MKVSTSDVAPISGAFELVPEGTYHVRIQDATETLSKNQNPMFVLDLEILDTDQKGRSLRDWITYLESTRGIVRGFLEAIQHPGAGADGDVEASSLIGRTGKVVIRHDSYFKDGATEPTYTAKVMAWEQASGAFHATPGTPVSAAQREDSDIPFMWREHTPDRVHNYNPFA